MMENKKYYFIADKPFTVEDILRATGIRVSNFWFEHFLDVFSKSCEEIDEYTMLIKSTDDNREKVIRTLADYNIDGLSFIGKKAIILTLDDQFSHVSFKLIKSRKIKVISSEEFK